MKPVNWMIRRELQRNCSKFSLRLLETDIIIWIFMSMVEFGRNTLSVYPTRPMISAIISTIFPVMLSILNLLFPLLPYRRHLLFAQFSRTLCLCERTIAHRAPIQTSKKKRKTLVLDLDETLVHARCNSTYLSHDFAVEVVMGHHACLYYIYKRPYCDFFLRKVSEWYNVVVYTASMPGCLYLTQSMPTECSMCWTLPTQ